MKKLFLLVIAMLLVCSLSYAEQTSGATYTGNSGKGHCQDIADFLNCQDCIDHTHKYEQEKANYALGLGVDFVVFEADPKRTGAEKLIPDAVEIQNKYDFANENGSTFIVAKYNIWDVFVKKEAE